MADKIILVVLLAAVVLAALGTVRRKRTGGGCCGSRATIQRVKVEDRHKTHYPHKAFVKVDGMVCANCAVKVENALNSLKDTWATAEMDQGQMLVRTKQPLDEAQIRQAVSDAGYTVTEITVL